MRPVLQKNNIKCFDNKLKIIKYSITPHLHALILNLKLWMLYIHVMYSSPRYTLRKNFLLQQPLEREIHYGLMLRKLGQICSRFYALCFVVRYSFEFLR